jgi:hypothetical protein
MMDKGMIGRCRRKWSGLIKIYLEELGENCVTPQEQSALAII